MFMRTHGVVVACDVRAKLLDSSFRYRVYVNDELFTERTWIWHDVYLEENIVISAPAGIYPIRFEHVDPESGRVKVTNFRTDVEMLEENINALQNELSKTNDEIKQAAIRAQMNEETLHMQNLKNSRNVRIITHQGQTAVEITDAST